VAGPGGIEGGRVRGVVLPDTSKFLPALKKYLDRIERSLRIQIPTELDVRGLRDDLERVRQQTERARPARMPVAPDTDLFAKRVRSDVARIAAGIEADIPLTVEGERLRREVAEQVQRIQRQLSVEIPLDPEAAAAARNKLAVEVDLLKAMARRDPVEIPVEVNVDRARVQAEVREVQFSLSRLMSGLGRMLSGGARFVGFGALGISAAAVIPQIAALTAAVASASGALLLLPAIAGGAALGIGALAVGLQGFGDALKNMGDTEKFNEALKNLSPNAQAAARAIRSLAPAWTEMRKVVQDNLFEGTARGIQQLAAAYLPRLRQAFGILASDVNKVGAQLKRFALSPATKASFDTFFINVTKGFRAMSPAIVPVLQILRDLSVVGSGFLPQLGGAVASVTQRFAGFIAQARQTGALQDWIQTGLQALKALGSIASSVGRILYVVVSTLSDAGGGLQGLAGVLDTVATVVSGPAFTKGLLVFFQGISAGVQALSGALPAVGAALAALAPVLGQLATGVGTVAGQALKALATAAIGLAPALGPAVGLLSSLASGVLTALTPLLGAIAQSISALLVPAFAALRPVIPVIVSALTQMSTIMAGALRENMPGLVTAGQNLGTALAALATQLAPLLPAFGRLAAEALPKVIQTINVLLPIITKLINFIGPKLVPAIQHSMASFGRMVQMTQDVTSAFVRVAGAVGRAAGQIAGFVRRIGSTVADIAKAFATMATGVASKIAGFLSDVGAIPGKIKSALGDLSGLLVQAGKDIIAGLASGIRQAAGEAASAAANAAKSALSAAKNALGIKSPSREFMKIGQFVGQGFIDGITGTAAQVQSAVRTLMNKVMNVALTAVETKNSLNKRLASLQAAYERQVARIDSVQGTAAQRRAIQKRNADARARAAQISKQIADTRRQLEQLRTMSAEIDTVGERNALARYLGAQQKALTAIATKRSQVAAKLAAAKKQLEDAVKLRDDFFAAVRQNVQQFGAITSTQFNAGFDNVGNILDSMRSRLAQITAFRQNLDKLKRLGLNNQTYKELVDAGVDGGAAAAEILAKGGKAAIGQVNALASQIGQQATGLASEASKALYQAGVDAARGLVQGLQSQSSALAKAAQTLANQIVAAIKKALKISSPSQVLADQVGRHIPTGIVKGIDSTAGQLDRRMASLVAAATPAVGDQVGGRGGGATIQIIGYEYDTADSIATRTAAKLEFQGAA
jgi:phage-related protein